MKEAMTMPRLLALLDIARLRTKEAARGDDGATAIEWAIFAILALTIGGLVAGAITLAVNNRIPTIK
jgi:hypothetical protein